MKKLIVFIILLIFIAICSFGVDKNIFQFWFNYDIQIYASELSTCFDGNYDKNGEGYIVYTNDKLYNETIKNVNGIYGLSLHKKSNLYEFNSIRENVKILKMQELEDITTFYGFIEGENLFCYIDGLKVNIQVSYNKSNHYLIIGFPIILGSY